jgi:hypothetical protein
LSFEQEFYFAMSGTTDNLEWNLFISPIKHQIKNWQFRTAEKGSKEGERAGKSTAEPL